MDEQDKWREDANCRVMYDDKGKLLTEKQRLKLFFPFSGKKTIAKAKEVCAKCIVIDECRNAAFEEELHLNKVYVSGVRGGMSAQERYPKTRIITGLGLVDKLIEKVNFQMEDDNGAG